ncbi:MAG: hypothetical protein D4R45_05850 [Planctomycetaceae bacterium]|nr:MAG: hypothetical protein D4R45_05850 [Planctomycetaceae bacterium]
MKQTPQKTVHNWCHYRVQSRSDKDVEDCTEYTIYATGKPCPFYEYRMGNKRISVKVFRKLCLECMGESSNMVADCEQENCSIYSYRFGKNPARAGMIGHRGGNLANLRRKPLLTVPDKDKTDRTGTTVRRLNSAQTPPTLP